MFAQTTCLDSFLKTTRSFTPMDSSADGPFWGHQTSYLNFCEEDYVITRYIAEFINTFSSLIYIVYGIYGLARLYQKRHATLSRSIPYFGLMGVGVCSAGYHMTLKYHTQMSDELSMHLLVTPLLYRIFTIQTSPQHTKLIGILFLTEFTVVMVVHMVMNEFLLHAVAFGLGVLLIATQTIKLVSQRVPDPFTRKKFRNIGLFGVCSFVFGYMVWLIDEWACNPLIRIRHSVGLPLAFVFELHGWWHVFTAIGGYIAVEVVDMITSGEVHEDPTDQLAWPIADVARFIGGTPGTKKSS
ncbi:alkaline ceramidase YPC1 [Aspergillus udagawae]|uniref:Alkaline ceramidase YPC1 n=1 Tax=Aspergillus udagawae TaxID=91492 RepID=A0A8H3RQG8_9EURO|nr:alkaline ceramidase YPC1 [Aspergillus udagawae]